MLTLGTTYYENPEHLEKFIEYHLPFVNELIVVDDGSKIFKAVDVIDPHSKIKLYRVKKDLGFNSHGCRNLIMKEASFDWVALLDADRLFLDEGKELLKIKTDHLDPLTHYKFIVHGIIEGEQVHQGVNDYLINKELFFKAGGYDEELVGIRTGDRDFFCQLAHFGRVQTSPAQLKHTRISSAYLEEEHHKARINGVNFSKPVPESVRRIIESRKIKPDPNKPILTFEWERVF